MWVTKHLHKIHLVSLFKVQITGPHPRLSKSDSLEAKTQESAFSQVSSVTVSVYTEVGACHIRLGNFLNWQYFHLSHQNLDQEATLQMVLQKRL